MRSHNAANACQVRGIGRGPLLSVHRTQHPEHRVELTERDSADVLDLLERLARELGLLVEHVAADTGLHHHHVHRVTERVVQLTREARSLLEHEAVSHGLLLTGLEQRGGPLHLAELAAISRGIAQQRGERRGDADPDERAHIDRTAVGDRVDPHGHREQSGRAPAAAHAPEREDGVEGDEGGVLGDAHWEPGDDVHHEDGTRRDQRDEGRRAPPPQRPGRGDDEQGGEQGGLAVPGVARGPDEDREPDERHCDHRARRRGASNAVATTGPCPNDALPPGPPSSHPKGIVALPLARDVRASGRRHPVPIVEWA